MPLAERLLEAVFKTRKIKSVEIRRLKITITWGAIDAMDDDQVKEFDVSDDIRDAVNRYLSLETSSIEKQRAKREILRRLL